MKSEINIGDCFLFKANSKTYSFIAFGSMKYKRQLFIKFIPVTFSVDITKLNDVVLYGLVFSQDVWDAEALQNKTGLFMFDIGLNDSELIDQFMYLGKVEIDQEKVFCCGGTSGLKRTDLVRFLLWLDNGWNGHVKLPLKNFIQP